jgi:hypothetical protein
MCLPEANAGHTGCIRETWKGREGGGLYTDGYMQVFAELDEPRLEVAMQM